MLIENAKLDIAKVYKLFYSEMYFFIFLFVNSLFKWIGLRKQVQLIVASVTKFIYIYI